MTKKKHIDYVPMLVDIDVEVLVGKISPAEALAERLKIIIDRYELEVREAEGNFDDDDRRAMRAGLSILDEMREAEANLDTVMDTKRDGPTGDV